MSNSKIQLLDPADSPSLDHQNSQKIQNFLSWLEYENIQWNKEKISLEYRPNYGYYFVAKQSIPANEILFQSWYHICITKDIVFQHEILGQYFLKMKNSCPCSSNEDFHRWTTYAFLMYEKCLESRSRWSPYLNILPSLEEFEFRVPTLMDSAYYCQCLGGSTLEEYSIPNHQQNLKKIYQNFIFPLFSQLFSPDIVSSSYSFRHFKWATAIYLSRAILIPDAHGQTSEALCPLLDLMNHRPGTLSTLQIDGKLGRQQILYSVGRTLKEGEEICLNYGARSNGDLLGYFGFTLRENIADVYLWNNLAFSSSLQHQNYTQSIALFVNCDIPEALLLLIRQKLYFEESLTSNTTIPTVDIESVYHIETSSYSDWLHLEDDALPPINFDLIGSVISLQNELLTLSWLKTYFTNKCSALMSTIQRNQDELVFAERNHTNSLCYRIQFLSDCQVYLYGQVQILEYLCKKLNQMINSLNQIHEIENR